MGKQKTAERNQARDLFVNSGLNIKEAAAIVKVAPAHVGKWCKEDNWETQRTAQLVTAEKIIAGWYGALQKINEEIQKQKGLSTSAQADQISKLTDSIAKLSKKNNLSMYHGVLKEFMNDLLQADAETAKLFATPMLDFLKRKAAQLSNNA